MIFTYSFMFKNVFILDSYLSNTTSTNASATTTCLSPPPSANNYDFVCNHISSSSDNNNNNNNNIVSSSDDNERDSTSINNTNRKPSLSLHISSFPIISSSSTVMNDHQSFLTPNTGVEHSHSASILNHHNHHRHRSQSLTGETSNDGNG